MMLLRTVPEGLILGALLIIVCALGIRNGAVGMACMAALLSGVMALCIR